MEKCCHIISIVVCVIGMLLSIGGIVVGSWGVHTHYGFTVIEGYKYDCYYLPYIVIAPCYYWQLCKIQYKANNGVAFNTMMTTGIESAACNPPPNPPATNISLWLDLSTNLICPVDDTGAQMGYWGDPKSCNTYKWWMALIIFISCFALVTFSCTAWIMIARYRDMKRELAPLLSVSHY